MDDLILQPAALDILEVKATATATADPGFFYFFTFMHDFINLADLSNFYGGLLLSDYP